MRILTCLVEDHNLVLVALAAAICIAGSVVTTRIYARARQNSGVRAAWLFMGAVAGGATIWCTHFVAMLAYRPGADVTYEPVITAASLVVAMLGCAAALAIGAVRMPRAAEIGGVVFGLTVTAMHYVGMAAFSAEAVVQWSIPYVAGSAVAAVAGGVAAFHLAARSDLRHAVWMAPLALVLTIVALHFTGMGALTVIPLAPIDGRMTGEDASALLAVGVAAVGLLMLGVATASHVLETHMRRLSHNRYRSLIEGSVDGMLVEVNGAVLIANAAFLEMCGVEPADVTGVALDQWLDDASTMSAGVLIQSLLKPKQGEPIPVEVAVRSERDTERGQPFRIFAVRDLRARLAQERRIAHLARNDSLTGLPNRTSFLEKLERLAAVSAPGDQFALMAIDLDRFKEVNDVYGHAVGDQLLRHVADRVRSALGSGEFVARLGGDEFVALAPISDRMAALEVAERLRAAMIEPLQVEHSELQCGASVGVAVWPDDTREPSALINNADLAMYRAKTSLTADICFYEEAMDEAVRQRRRITQGLREALDQDRFELHYQAQVSIETGQVTGYEALLRWRQADGAHVSPADFIPIAEDTGLILPIGEWVLRQACAEAARWPLPHRIAVNLSPVQLSHVDLPRLLHQILIDTGLSPARLELEITETAMISDLARTTHVLRQIKALGVSVAMDDFGTGYSSLSTLRAFPFDKIKLDRSFMSELDASPQSQAIIRAVLTLGESLNIPVLAEGVETEAQLRFLRDQGCDQAQGYLLGRPSRRAAQDTDAEAATAAA